MQALNPKTIAAPFGRYSHGVVTSGTGRLVLTSGQLGLRADGSLPDGALAPYTRTRRALHRRVFALFLIADSAC